MSKGPFFYKKPLKVVIFGPQNTGKTTLCEVLAKVYKTEFVPEFSRLFAESHKELSYDTVMPIANGQQQLEQDYLKKTTKDILFFDTNLLETVVYSRLYYDEIPGELCDMMLNQEYDLYFLNFIDVPWKEDGIRDRPNNREDQYELFKSYLLKYNANFYELRGSVEEKSTEAQQIINQYIKI